MQNVIKITNDFILKHSIKDLPLDFNGLVKICGLLGYKVLSYSQAKDAIIAMGAESFTKYLAFARHTRSSKYVFFDDTLSVGMRNFAIAHEIGHIELQHNYIGNIGYTGADTVQEREANTFAYQLLAPLCVLRAMNISNIADIQSNTLLDKEQAKVILKALHQYKTQPRADELIKLYGIRFPQNHIGFSVVLILFCVALSIFSIFFCSLPETLESEETTSSFLSSLKQKQQAQLSPINETTPASEAVSESIDQSETVYITRSGERYHKQNCYHIKNKTTSALSISEAIEDGYTACKSCYK